MAKHWHEKHAEGHKIATDASTAHVGASARYRKRIADGEFQHRAALAAAASKRSTAQAAAQAKFNATRDPNGADHAPARLLIVEMAAADSAFARGVAEANHVAASERSLAASEFHRSGGSLGHSL
jgi:hypothetical protein